MLTFSSRNFIVTTFGTTPANQSSPEFSLLPCLLTLARKLSLQVAYSVGTLRLGASAILQLARSIAKQLFCFIVQNPLDGPI